MLQQAIFYKREKDNQWSGTVSTSSLTAMSM